MLGLLLPLPGLEHFVSSWVHLTWKAFWEQLLWWVHLCMELGMSGLAMPTSIFMIMNSLVLLRMSQSFIDMLKQNCCLSGPHFPPPAIVEALQDYVTNYHKVRRLHLIVVDLWRPWKYNTARAREITDQLWRISDCDDTRRVSPVRPEGPAPPLRCRRFAYGYVTWSGLKEMGNLILCWIPLQLTRLFWINPSFAPWACSISTTPLHLFLKFVSAGKLWPYLAWGKMSFYLTCTLPELGCCVSGLALIETEQKSLRRSSSWLPMRWTQVWFPAHWAPVVLQQLT